MKSKTQSRSGLVDLGAASSETKGAIGFYSDDVLKRDTPPGLSAE
jgi:hypothetical protein